MNELQRIDANDVIYTEDKDIVNKKILNNKLKYNIDFCEVQINYLNKIFHLENISDASNLPVLISYALQELPHKKIALRKVEYVEESHKLIVDVIPLITSA